MPLLAPERHQKILDLLEQSHKLLTLDVAKQLNTSAATIRRDFNELANKGLVARAHGGIIKAKPNLAEELSFATKASRMQTQKTVIARRAAAEIHDGATIIMDAGTTMLELAKHLAGRRLTIIALDLPAAHTLAMGATEVLLVGGRVRSHSFSMTGHWAEQSLKNLHADLFLMGAHAIDKQGVSNAGLEEAVLKQVALDISDRTILLADHSKFNERALIQICGLESIDTIITDNEFAWVDWLEDTALEIIVAD